MGRKSRLKREGKTVVKKCIETKVADLAEHRYWNYKDWIAWFCCLGFVLFLICFEGVILK